MSGPIGGARRTPGAALALPAAALLASACQEQLPTASRDDLVPAGTTVEVVLPFESFGDGARVFGGYGRASDLGGGFVARDYGGASPGDGLAAATLARFGGYPDYVSVTDTTGTTRPDSSISFLSGRVVVRFNADGSVTQGPVEVTAHAVNEPWDQASAGWEYAVDSIDERTPWSVPGGGRGEQIGAVHWDPASGDSLEFAVDSALVAAWADSADLSKGVRLSTTASGVRLQVSRSVSGSRFFPASTPTPSCRPWPSPKAPRSSTIRSRVPPIPVSGSGALRLGARSWTWTCPPLWTGSPNSARSWPVLSP